MSNYVIAAVLGIIEGLTEFLPVSSTAHLVLAGDLLGFKGPQGKTFEIMIQFGAILALCVLYFRKLASTVIALPSDPDARKFATLIIIAFLPAAILGATFNKMIKELLESHKVIGATLLVGGIVMILVETTARRVRYTQIEQVPYLTALIIGFAQALAMVPGVSRSGATIIGGLMLGLERRVAAELSFYLAIPTMLGAFVYSGWKYRKELSFDDAGLIAIGFVCAFLAALLIVKPFLAIISRHGFIPFALYRIALGALVLGLIYL